MFKVYNNCYSVNRLKALNNNHDNCAIKKHFVLVSGEKKSIRVISLIPLINIAFLFKSIVLWIPHNWNNSNTKIWWLNNFLWLTTFKQLYIIHKSPYSYELLLIAFQQIFIEDWLDLSLMFILCILFHNQNIYYDKNKNVKTTFKIFPIWR